MPLILISCYCKALLEENNKNLWPTTDSRHLASSVLDAARQSFLSSHVDALANFPKSYPESSLASSSKAWPPLISAENPITYFTKEMKTAEVGTITDPPHSALTALTTYHRQGNLNHRHSFLLVLGA